MFSLVFLPRHLSLLDKSLQNGEPPSLRRANNNGPKWKCGRCLQTATQGAGGGRGDRNGASQALLREAVSPPATGELRGVPTDLPLGDGQEDLLPLADPQTRPLVWLLGEGEGLGAGVGWVRYVGSVPGLCITIPVQ
ncbi:hypothetical protein COCON_G00129480 [Conger conger]|uniref:Uncharacterized protein n=1 Tax=Conger conger TaxID=82655 RepID=A0A9Q1HX06_CONCO|nr:hypothetical protein COCON_G00129480 [Conger conger]